MKQFQSELSQKERTMLFQENASKIEETSYQKALTQDELTIRMEYLADNCIKLSQMEDELKIVKG